MENLWAVLISAILSGIFATIVTLWWQSKNQLKREKTKIFTILMSKRYEISAEESVEALNMIDIVFYKSEKVRKAWRDFNETTKAPESATKNQNISDKHLKLLEVIAEDIGYSNIKWNDIKEYYYPKGLSDRKQEESALRRVQIDAAIAQLQKEGKTENSQINKNDELAGQVILEMMKNPDGLLKLMDVAEKAQKFQKK